MSTNWTTTKKKKKKLNVQLTNTETEKKKNLNRIITSKENELIIKNIPTKKSPGLEWLHWWILSKFKEKLTLLLKLFQKTDKNGTLPIHFIRPVSPRYQNEKMTLLEKKLDQ